MRFAVGQGILDYLEPAPGKVLAGLMGKIDERARVRSVAAPADLEAAAGAAPSP
jgi:hypothetical protein